MNSDVSRKHKEYMRMFHPDKQVGTIGKHLDLIKEAYEKVKK